MTSLLNVYFLCQNPAVTFSRRGPRDESKLAQMLIHPCPCNNGASVAKRSFTSHRNKTKKKRFQFLASSIISLILRGKRILIYIVCKKKGRESAYLIFQNGCEWLCVKQMRCYYRGAMKKGRKLLSKAISLSLLNEECINKSRPQCLVFYFFFPVLPWQQAIFCCLNIIPDITS